MGLFYRQYRSFSQEYNFQTFQNKFKKTRVAYNFFIKNKQGGIMVRSIILSKCKLNIKIIWKWSHMFNHVRMSNEYRKVMQSTL